MKLPRKLKKAKKHFYFTKQWYDLDDKKKFIISRRLGLKGVYWDITLKRMCKPYPETKWIRKYRQYLLNIRKKTSRYRFAPKTVEVEPPSEELTKVMHEEYKTFEAEHGKEIDAAIAKDFGAFGIHCQQLMDELGTEITYRLDSTRNRQIEMDWMRKFYKSLPNLSGQHK